MSKVITIKALVPEKKDAAGKVVNPQVGPFQINLTTGANAKELIELYGDEAVYSNAMANFVVTVQGNMRANMKKGTTQEALQAALGSAKMGVTIKSAPVDPKQAMLAQAGAMSPADLEKFIADLKARQAKK
jgi:hypothetical protein